MKRYLQLSVLIVVLCVPAMVFAQTPTLHMVEMRDGVRLATDVYVPEGQGPWPVILGRTPYGRQHPGSVKLYPATPSRKGVTRQEVLDSGIAIVIQETRGVGDSEGEIPLENPDSWGELQDGYDTVAWIREQAWCNGRIAGAGSSAGGMKQIGLAGTGPEGMVGQLIYQAPISGYHYTTYPGGVFHKVLVETWLNNEAVMYLLVGNRSHPYYDELWQIDNLAERVDRVNWPVTVQASWYDVFQQGTIDLYTEIRERGGPHARENVFLLIGPYHHMNFDLRKGPEEGELTLPEGAHVPLDRWPKDGQWIKHWLLGEPLDPKPPRVLYYVMGELPVGNGPGNEWRAADDWPPPSEVTPWFLTTDNTLQSKSPSQGGELRYTYDPQNPVPTLGGKHIYLRAGPYDQRPVEDREDVLLFTSEVLAEPVEVTGRIKAVLYVSTSGKDTDFAAKLTDVYPDGRSMLLCDGIRKLSLREDFSQPQEVVPGARYRVEVDLSSTSIAFNTGHRIRLAVSSSNSPQFEPNPNTGNPDWTSTETVIAEQTVYVGGDQGSHLLLPIAIEPVTEVEQSEGKVLPSGYHLSQNVPNPFNPITTIGYDLPEASEVALTVHTLTGQQVTMLASAHQEPGHYEVLWDGNGLASGIYFYRLEAGRFADTKRMLLLK